MRDDRAGVGTNRSRGRHVDLVFEGGGVKGIALVGAYSVLEEEGYEPQNMAGASAGAIVATLIAAGYTSDELKEIISKLDYDQFKDEALEEWMRELLEAKGKHTFGDLVRREDVELRYRYKLQVIASDVTERLLLVLPRDAPKLGIEDPDDLDVAHAVRMSMSIPVFFEPVRFPNPGTREEHLIVDGGMLSNFPVWLFDAEVPQWPTFGLKLTQEQEIPLGEQLPQPVPRGGVTQVIGYLRSLVDTMMAAHDRLYIEDHEFDRTIAIDTLGVGTTEFDLSQERALALYGAGREAARKFLAKHRDRERLPQP